DGGRGGGHDAGAAPDGAAPVRRWERASVPGVEVLEVLEQLLVEPGELVAALVQVAGRGVPPDGGADVHDDGTEERQRAGDDAADGHAAAAELRRLLHADDAEHDGDEAEDDGEDVDE